MSYFAEKLKAAAMRFPGMIEELGDVRRFDFPRTYDPSINPDAGVVDEGRLLTHKQLSKQTGDTVERVGSVLEKLSVATLHGYKWSRDHARLWELPGAHLLGSSGRSSRGFVYFITDGSGFVKIGTSVSVEQRLANLQAANPRKLEIQRVLSGGRELEKRLHQHFHRLRGHGEWFRRDEELDDYLRMSCDCRGAA